MSLQIQNFVGLFNILILLIDEIHEIINSESIVALQTVGFERCSFDNLESVFLNQ